MSKTTNASARTSSSPRATVARPCATRGPWRPAFRPTLLASLLVALVAAGCGHGRGGSKHHVDVVEHLWETEPNDHAWDADFFGSLAPGDRLVIHGGVDDLGPDLRDGFAFVSTVPGHVDFALRSLHGADLDVCIYDAATDEIVFCFESPWDPERGGFEAFGSGGEFHFVVSSFAGSSDYVLEIAVSSPGGLAAATHAAERGARERVAPYLREPRSAAPEDAAGADPDELAPLLTGLEITVEHDGRVRRRAFELGADGRVMVAVAD